ncbi:MAG: glycosyltransferase family 25 protein [Cyanobacteria bacterium P01_G01_bin.54]
MKFMDFFDRAYVINLPKRSDRRTEITRELAKAEMPFKVGKVELFAAIRPEAADPFKSIGAKGAFLSHLTVLKSAQAANLSNVLVLEDDLQFTPDFKQYEAILLKELEGQDWDIVQFGYCTGGFNRKREFGTSLLAQFEGENTGAHCYAVNGKILEQLIAFLEALQNGPVGDPHRGPISIDGAFNVFKWCYPTTVNRLIAVPCFARQRSSASDISTSWFDQTPGLRQAADVARKVPGVRHGGRFVRRQVCAPLKRYLAPLKQWLRHARKSAHRVPSSQSVVQQPSNCHSIG